MDKTTQDSIEALEALLKIRDSKNGDAQALGPTTPTASHFFQQQTNVPTMSTGIIPNNMQSSLSNFSFPLNSASSISQGARGVMNLNLYPNNALTGPPFAVPLSFSQQRPQVLNQNAFPVPSLNPITPGILQHGISVASACSAGKMSSALPQSYSSTVLRCTPIAPQSKTQSNKEENKETVRKSEIEATLKSKPQRGRKRENLNGLERQELTRTRNREHAKTTRIRKKARYEELNAFEQKYMSLLRAQEFEQARKESVVKFMSVRSDFLKTKKGNCNESSGWNFSFEHDTSSCKSEDINNESSYIAPYVDVVHDVNSFSVDLSSGLTLRNGASLSGLQAYDNRILSQIKAKIGEDSHFEVQYKIIGSQDGVAISRNNGGFAQYEFLISLQNKGGKIIILKLSTGCLQVKFAEQSNKILSINIFTVSDGISSLRTANLQNAALGNSNFPSVVSLEQSCSVTCEKNES